MMRRFAFLLAFLVAARALAPALGYLVALEKHVERVARFLKKGEAEAVRFSFSKTEKNGLIWVKKGREFWLDGQLFDVEKMAEKGDSTIIFAHLDRKEMSLHEAFSHQKKGDENDFSRAAWASFLAAPMEFLEPSVFLISTFFDEKRSFFYQKRLVSVFFERTEPPPEPSFFSRFFRLKKFKIAARARLRRV